MQRVLQMPDNSPERFCMIEHTMPWEGPVLPQLAPHELLVCVPKQVAGVACIAGVAGGAGVEELTRATS